MLVLREKGNTVSGRQYFMNTCCLALYSAADVIDEVRLVSEDLEASSTNLRVSFLGAYLRLSSGGVRKSISSADIGVSSAQMHQQRH